MWTCWLISVRVNEHAKETTVFPAVVQLNRAVRLCRFAIEVAPTTVEFLCTRLRVVRARKKPVLTPIVKACRYRRGARLLGCLIGPRNVVPPISILRWLNLLIAREMTECWRGLPVTLFGTVTQCRLVVPINLLASWVLLRLLRQMTVILVFLPVKVMSIVCLTLSLFLAMTVIPLVSRLAFVQLCTLLWGLRNTRLLDFGHGTARLGRLRLATLRLHFC